MEQEARSRSADTGIAEVAAQQHGLITSAQLHALGLGDGGIALRVRRGRLHRLHRAVYLVGYRAPSRRTLELGAVLATGPGSVLSHRSAARFWSLLPQPTGVADIDVTAIGRKPQNRTGIHVHQVRSLERRDWAIRDRIPVTQPARTLLDLAARSTGAELAEAVNEAHALRLVGRAQLELVLARHPGRAGTRRLVDVAGLDGSGHRTTRSAPERRLLKLLTAAGLPPPETNAAVGGYEVDLLWRDRGLVVEVDAWSTHGSRTAFERDRRRDARLAALGLTVVRVTADQVRADPQAAVDAIRSACLRRGRPT